jgi:hypothetical protein
VIASKHVLSSSLPCPRGKAVQQQLDGCENKGRLSAEPGIKADSANQFGPVAGPAELS